MHGGFLCLGSKENLQFLEVRDDYDAIDDKARIYKKRYRVIAIGASAGGGQALAEQMKSRIPEIKVVYMSGYTDDSIAHHGVLENDVDFIQKPLTRKGLAVKIREVLEKSVIKSGPEKRIYRSRNMIEKQVFFWTLSGVVKPSRSIGFRCRVSGFRLALAFSLLTPDT